MNFLSLSFAGFGVLVFAGWWGLPAKARPWLLAAANLVFAGLFEARAVICLLILCLVGYLCGLWAHKGSRVAMWLGILLCALVGGACFLGGRWSAGRSETAKIDTVVLQNQLSEIRELATQMLREVRAVAPHIFEKAGPPCLRGACPEGKMSCGNMAEVREKFQKL